MARIAGVDLPGEKRIEVALTYIFGVGQSVARDILRKAEVDGNLRTKELDESQVADIRKIIESDVKVEGDLRKEVSTNIKMLMDLGTYRGLRHRKGLPVRGQRTNTNARTRKGPRRSIAGKKKPPRPK
ncbi:MAG: 30S ribosomal protein S13 [Proteobacteria bacterium]|jgi:small subunit ribosomal protein S13|nr:30S ribosomal protein S13 [Pseudomonadota bacterium]